MFRLLCVLLLLTVAKCEEKPANPSVIIIGAGASGIAAATKLLKNGFTNIKILEAEDRIGGRVNSVHFGDAYVDMGAEWCHGEEGNPIWELIKDLDLVKHSDYEEKWYYANGKRLNETIEKDLRKFYDELELDDEKVEERCSNITSVGECAISLYEQHIVPKYKDDPETSKIIRDGLSWIQLAVQSYEAALSWKDVRVKQDYDEVGGDLLLNWNGNGYRTFLELLMEKHSNKTGLPIMDKLELNKEVEKVTYTDKINVTTKDGSIYEADYVIITPSVGVLRRKMDDMFEPKLPAEKAEAIKGIGLGCVVKVVMHFPTKWWDTEGHKDMVKDMVWNQDEKDNIKDECPECVTKDGRIWITHLFAIVNHRKNQQVLTGWISGELVPEIEKLSDDVILKGAVYAMKKFFGQTYKLVEPDKMIRSSWCTNPHFYGTWSYESVADPGNNKNFRKTLGKSLVSPQGTPVVLFAGEASDPGQFGTVGGATRSGFREAQKIMDLHKTTS